MTTQGRSPLSLEPLSEAGAKEMIARLQRRNAASDAAAKAAREHQKNAKSSVSEEADVRRQLALAELMFEGGKFSKAEYFFYSLVQVERVHDTRCLAGVYDGELQPIMGAMLEIERAHGLEEDESFYLDSAPSDWLKLNRDYDAVLRAKLEDTLVEFGLLSLLHLRREDKDQFDRLRETGRLAFFSESGAEANILNLIEIYERETKCAAMAGAYFAAAMSLACAAEARIILHCIRRPDAALAAAQRLAAKVRPRNTDPLSWTVEQIVALAHAGGWLHNLPDEQLVVAVATWLENLPARGPGQQVLGGRPPGLGESEFETARDAYVMLRYSLDLAANSSQPSETLQ
jgi:hypothetical protein